MSFFEFVYDLAVGYVGSDFFELWFYPLFALFFVGVVPRVIRDLTRWR